MVPRCAVYDSTLLPSHGFGSAAGAAAVEDLDDVDRGRSEYEARLHLSQCEIGCDVKMPAAVLCGLEPSGKNLKRSVRANWVVYPSKCGSMSLQGLHECASGRSGSLSCSSETVGICSIVSACVDPRLWLGE